MTPVPNDCRAAEAHHAPSRRGWWPRWRRRLIVVGLLGVVAAVAAELVAQFALGLGDPPLVMADPEFEYLFRPSRAYNRFGHRIAINSHSMRSEEFPQAKSRPDELRILVIGDSIVFGTTHVDQVQIATERLKERLRRGLRRPVTVGNISAGSWGPENELAWARRFGFYEADVVIVVLNSRDAEDIMAFTPLPSFMPQRKPVLAIEEAVTRYLPQLLGRVAGDPVPATPPSAAEIERSVNAARELLVLARASGAAVVLVQHLMLEELRSGPEPGHARFTAVAAELGVPIVQAADDVRPAVEAGESVYQDEMHYNARGQELLAAALFRAIEAAGVMDQR